MKKKYINQLKQIIKNKEYTYFKSKEGYILLPKSKNKTLFSLLKKAGFFIFHKTNKGKIVGVHQVVLFIYKGWKSLAFKGECIKGKTEIHHIDHNPSNNNHHNLEYTTPVNNKAIATIVNICCNSTSSYYNSQVQFDLDKVLMFGPSNFIELLLKSIKATQQFFDKDLFKELMFALPFKQSKFIYNSLIKYAI